MLVNAKPYYKKKIQERASELTEGLYDKYKNVLELNIERDEKGCKIILKDAKNKQFFIPTDFFKLNKFFFFKENLISLIFLSEKGNISWEDLCLNLIRYASFITEKPNLLNLKTLEKIRFLLSFMNINSRFDFENIPEEFKKIKYNPKYYNWRNTNTYYQNYKKYIKKDEGLFREHINLLAIPYYPAWNLELKFYDFTNIEYTNDLKLVQYYPIQVFENIKGKTIGIIGLTAKNNKTGKNIEKLSISYNFNIFNNIKKGMKKFYPENSSIFDSFVIFLDEKENNEQNCTFYMNNFSSIINFKRKHHIPDYISEFLTKHTISEYNLLYDRNLSKFISKFLSDTDPNKRTLRFLFKSNFNFLDFNRRNSFILILNKKKRNLKFNDLISFIQNWTYQTITYELKDKFLIFGYVFSNFLNKYSKEMVILNDLFVQLNIDYRFYISNKDYKDSDLSLYNLPSSNQFQDKNSTWNLNLLEYPISIRNKEKYIIKQIKDERLLIKLF